MLGRRIWGKRIGIIGMGRIGTAVARRAKAFGLSIHYHNRKRVNPATENELEATYWDSLDQMLARVDIVSVNCPSTPATFHLLSARRLALLQPTSYIVNTARGDIIDEDALIQCLREGKIAGAGLDVFEKEPAVNPKLVKLANEGKVVLLPHTGSATIEGRIDMGDKVIINIRTYFDGHRPPTGSCPTGLSADVNPGPKGASAQWLPHLDESRARIARMGFLRRLHEPPGAEAAMVSCKLDPRLRLSAGSDSVSASASALSINRRPMPRPCAEGSTASLPT